MRARFQHADTGILVLDLPESNRQSIVWFLLDQRAGVTVPMDTPQSPTQVVAWYVILPQLEAPVMLPLLGVASPQDKALQQQLLEKKESPYSALLPASDPDGQTRTER